MRSQSRGLETAFLIPSLLKYLLFRPNRKTAYQLTASEHEMTRLHKLAIVVTLSGSALTTKERTHLPCEYTGPMSRKYPGTGFPMLSDAMKKRATNKVDLSGPVRQANIHSRVVMDVLVGADGNVVCVQGVRGHPMLLHLVEDVLRLWRFKPLIENNVPIAYVGQMDFMLCNINCGKKGPSMTLLK